MRGATPCSRRARSSRRPPSGATRARSSCAFRWTPANSLLKTSLSGSNAIASRTRARRLEPALPLEGRHAGLEEALRLALALVEDAAFLRENECGGRGARARGRRPRPRRRARGAGVRRRTRTRPPAGGAGARRLALHLGARRRVGEELVRLEHLLEDVLDAVPNGPGVAPEVAVRDGTASRGRSTPA